MNWKRAAGEEPNAFAQRQSRQPEGRLEIRIGTKNPIISSPNNGDD